MKKILILTIILIFGCSPKDLPLSPGSDLGKVDKYESTPPHLLDYYTLSFDLSLSSSPTRFEDIDTIQSDIQDEIILKFDEILDNTQLGSAFELTAYSGKTQGNISINVDYQRETRTVIITPLVPLLDSTTYILHIIQDRLRDLSSNPLDGNNNGLNDDSYDDIYLVFRGPAPDADTPDLNSPTLHSVDFLVGTLPDQIPLEDTIEIQFDDFDIDTSTLLQGISLLKYTDLTVQGNLTVTGIDTAGPPWSRRLRVSLAFSGLENAERYILKITPEIKDTAGNPLDCDGNDIIESDESYELVFTTLKSDSTPVEYPRVSSFDRDNNLITVRFTTDMNEYTLNSANIQIYRTDSTYIPCDIEYLATGDGCRCILKTNIDHGYIFISKTVESTDGYPLDGNGNGVGGETDDDVIINF